jgi:hypothetical protein
MEEVLQSAVLYGKIAVEMAIWIGLACVLVAGLERVVFSIIPRPSPDKAVVPAPVIELPPASQSH